MPLGMEVGLDPGHIVLDGYPAPPKKGHSPHTFGPCLLWPSSWMDQDAIWYEGKPRPRPHCVTWGSSFPHQGHSPNFRPCLLWPNGRQSQLLLSTSCWTVHEHALYTKIASSAFAQTVLRLWINDIVQWHTCTLFKLNIGWLFPTNLLPLLVQTCGALQTIKTSHPVFYIHLYSPHIWQQL